MNRGAVCVLVLLTVFRFSSEETLHLLLRSRLSDEYCLGERATAFCMVKAEPKKQGFVLPCVNYFLGVFSINRNITKKLVLGTNCTHIFTHFDFVFAFKSVLLGM